MGTAFSFLISPTQASTAPQSKPGLGDLPESCVASVLVYLDPPEICKLSMMNRAFRGASSADFIWESKLPANYDSLIQRVFQEDDSSGQSNNFPENLCKRDIYSRLSRPNCFDGGTKVRSFSFISSRLKFLFCLPYFFFLKKKTTAFCGEKFFKINVIAISHGGFFKNDLKFCFFKI